MKEVFSAFIERKVKFGSKMMWKELRKIRGLVSKESNFILVSIFILSFLGLLSLFIDQGVRTSQDHFFSFAHNYILDYYQYISWMKDGADGKFLITSRFSPDEFVRKPVYLFYPVAGFVFSKLGLNLFVGYTLLRIFLSLAKLFFVYLFIAHVFEQSNQRKLAFFLTLFLPPFYGIKPLRILLVNISSLDLLQRTFFIPHDLMTTIFLLGASVFFSQGLKSEKTKPLIIACFLLFLASVTNPVMLVIYYLFFFSAVFLVVLRQRGISNYLVWSSFLVLVSGLPLIVYYRYLFATTLPFSWMFDQQRVTTLNLSLKDFVLGCGPAVFLFPFSVPVFFKRKDFLSKLVISWAVLPFFLSPFLGKIIPLSQERIFEMSHFIPLAILATATISQVLGRYRVPGQILFLIFFLFVVFAAPYFYLSLKFQVEMFSVPYYNIFVPKSTIEAFNFLNENTPDESTVATGYYTGNMLPAFSHNKVLHGHDFVTFKADRRLDESQVILGLESDPEQVEEILRRNKISYVLLTPETPNFEQTSLPGLSSLRLIFFNEENFVYGTNY